MLSFRIWSKSIYFRSNRGNCVLRIYGNNKCRSICSRSTLDKVEDLTIAKLDHSPYLKPLRVNFKINSIEKKWDFLKIHNSVSILIYNTTRKVLILVKQFRPALYVGQIPNLSAGDTIDSDKFPINDGYSLELCGGICDKKESIVQVAKEEVLEECGYDVPLEKLRHLFNMRGVGVTGNVSSLFYVEVEDNEKVSEGGGLKNEGEFVHLTEMTVSDFKNYINSVNLQSPPNVVAAALWFFANKNK